jgi:hypothetical protein
MWISSWIARPVKMGQIGFSKTSVTKNLRCVKPQKSADVIGLPTQTSFLAEFSFILESNKINKVLVSSVSQLFFFLVVCSDMISKGFGLVTFFASVKASSVCIHLSCPVCIQSVVHGVRSRLFCGHTGCSLPEVSITLFLPLQFFVSVRLSPIF